MILSASRRTDIPAFYHEWFMNRVREGWFTSVNPFNPSQSKKVSLLPEDLDAAVFWSKNPRPLLEHLPELDSRGFRYYFQYTLNDYPGFLEPNVPAVDERVETLRKLAGMVGSRRVVWRYDPVVVSNLTPPDYHLEKFANLAGKLSGSCSRVVISFLDFYGKLEGRFGKLSGDYGFAPIDITLTQHSAELGRMAAEMSKIAASAGLDIFSCCEPVDLEEYGVRHGSCIDAKLINELFKLDLPQGKDANQRAGCLCAVSTDMGAYNCCGHGCTYCYANSSESRVSKNAAAHDPYSDRL